MSLITRLYNDDAGFLISAELVLVATILVLGMVVGLAEVQSAVVQELEDVASAFGAVNQSFRYSGLESPKKSRWSGSGFNDGRDACDSQWDIACGGVSREGR